MGNDRKGDGSKDAASRRSENSVLFSLNSLTAIGDDDTRGRAATKPTPGPSPSQPASRAGNGGGGAASGDELNTNSDKSGLIDLKTLTALGGSNAQQESRASSSAEAATPLFNVGSRRTSTGMKVGILLLVLAVGGLGYFLYYTMEKSAQEKAAAEAAAEAAREADEAEKAQLAAELAELQEEVKRQEAERQEREVAMQALRDQQSNAVQGSAEALDLSRQAITMRANYIALLKEQIESLSGRRQRDERKAAQQKLLTEEQAQAKELGALIEQLGADEANADEVTRLKADLVTLETEIAALDKDLNGSSSSSSNRSGRSDRETSSNSGSTAPEPGDGGGGGGGGGGEREMTDEERRQAILGGGGGGLESSKITSTLQAYGRAFKNCGDGVSGSGTVRYKIQPNGKVSGVSVSGDLAGTAAESCIKNVMGSIRFPSFSGSAQSESFPIRY